MIVKGIAAVLKERGYKNMHCRVAHDRSEEERVSALFAIILEGAAT